ncbi:MULTISPECIES: amino acid permease [unclassified Delftia]|uniref:amino acid permease n=1 Tax=unclassified Delftia TaxID=2613839 RepID=UPI00115443B3|nr:MULTISPECIES: amino acid permease [unclassified Delftia]MCB4788436.1 amino acid permease [Delftia sp. Lp-1]TQL82994.1 amino acid/polyamine/organocation transporter (APC superfamily) [Delftia sp. HK171]
MPAFEDIVQREAGLQQQLSAGQMTMIAIGGAVGTGLFLGSGFAIGFAGPSVLISYAIGAVISLLLMGCLAEMTVAHPTSGSFGAYAEHYIAPWAGFVVRYAYWACVVLAVGTEVTAVGLYMGYWFPEVPRWAWVVIFSGALIGVNMMSVKAFGAVEYSFSMIKIIAIVAFIVVGAWVVFGTRPAGVGFANYVNNGGFFPNGLWGTWVGVIIAIFSYLSIEMIAVAAGEAKDPQRAVTSAFRSTMVRLVVFYLATIALMLAIVPWSAAGKDGSPFVKVMEIIGLPGAASVVNFVVLVAALSAMNSQLYITTRMMFSLSRAGHAPAVLGRVNSRGVPLPALLLSCLGIAVATLFNIVNPEQSFMLMMAVAMFGAMFTWFMIFVTHLFFRIHWVRQGNKPLAFRMWGFPVLTLLGAALMLAALVSTLFTDVFRLTVLTGLPFLLLLGAIYAIWYRKPAGQPAPQPQTSAQAQAQAQVPAR